MEIKLKSSSFSSVSIETLETGVSILRVTQGQDYMDVPLLPEELGMILVAFGNAITDGRVEEQRRLEESNLMREKRKIKE